MNDDGEMVICGRVLLLLIDAGRGYVNTQNNICFVLLLLFALARLLARSRFNRA